MQLYLFLVIYILSLRYTNDKYHCNILFINLYLIIMKTLTKEKIAEKLSHDTGFSSALCEEIVDVTLKEMADLTIQEETLKLQNFGTLKIKHKQSRPGYNIHAKQAITITPRSVMRFIPSNALKNKIQ